MCTALCPRTLAANRSGLSVNNAFKIACEQLTLDFNASDRTTLWTKPASTGVNAGMFTSDEHDSRRPNVGSLFIIEKHPATVPSRLVAGPPSHEQDAQAGSAAVCADSNGILSSRKKLRLGALESVDLGKARKARTGTALATSDSDSNRYSAERRSQRVALCLRGWR